MVIRHSDGCVAVSVVGKQMYVNGHRLHWWNRLRWRLGMVPFVRCPDGRHTVRNIYGDEIIAANWHRSRCMYCQKLWPFLDGKDTA